MKKFTEYKQLNLLNTAKEISRFWDDEEIFKKSIETKEGNPKFIFYEGPPSANGLPGIHHVISRTIKDIFCRYQTQKGKQVFRKAGWDTHGLPVELGVEKELGITKEDIGTKISIEEYNEACKEAVLRYTDIWNKLTKDIGYWVDLEDPYITFEPKYMESVWWLIKQIYDKGLIYKGYTIQPYSPKAGTGLSTHELNMPGAYREVTDTTVVAQFKMLAPKDNTHPLWNSLFNIINFEKNNESCGGTHHWENTPSASEIFFMAWTTTPWTLPSNTALTVGANIEYVLIETFNQYTFLPQFVVIAKALVKKQFTNPYQEIVDPKELHHYKEKDKKIPYRIVRSFLGNELVGISYEQLFDWELPYEKAENAFKIIEGDFVTIEDGTGIVHTAPTFGADDAKVAKENDIPGLLILNEEKQPIPLVDLQGKFINNVPKEYAGKYVKNDYYHGQDEPEKSIDVELAIELKIRNRAFKVEKYKHSYPHCWRTDCSVLYYPLDSWFIKVTDVKEKMVNLNQQINWKPAATGEKRFGNWLENANDWNLSRSRFWGTPLPIWRTEKGDETICIGSIEELYHEIEKSIEKGAMTKNPYSGFVPNNYTKDNYSLIDLHKNIVDKIILVSKNGEKMYREADLIDVWFDSGAMPYAQNHYPFSNKEKLEDTFPADFIAEGVDQTRGWFYTLHAISTMVFDSMAYKNVMSNGLVLDKEGFKMSKSKGNTVDPFKTLEQFGPDATRWYMISNSNPWENLKFNIEGIDEVRKKFFGTLHNTYSFFSLYANVDDFTFSEDEIPLGQRPELDQWILSEMHTLIEEVDKSYEDYEPTRATRLIHTFVNDNLSNWFVRLSRRRYWKGEYTQDKIAAYQTLYSCLLTVSKLIAPISPFFADRLYKDLNSITNKEDYPSVHLSPFPESNAQFINKELQNQTHLAQTLTSMVFSLRKKDNIKVRQPLQKIMIPVLNKKMESDLQKIEEIIKQETNIKEIEFIDDKKANLIIEKNIKPNFKILGPKIGKDIKKVAEILQAFTSSEIAKLEDNTFVDILGHKILLEEVEIVAKDIPGWSVATNGRLTVALDITITDELKEEGLSRELVNRIQNLRKEKSLELTDTILLEIEKDEILTPAFLKNKEYIQIETLATDLIIKDKLENAIEIEIEEITSKINILKN